MPPLNPTSDPARVVAAFDFDGTLTRGDSLGKFLVHFLGWPRFLGKLLLCSPWLLAYLLGLQTNHRAKAQLLKQCFAGQSSTEVDRAASEFVTTQLPKLWLDWGLAQLIEHQKKGHCCVIVSASPSVYLHQVGRVLGVDAVLCTEMEVIDGQLTGLMASPNCHGEEKVRRLQNWREHGSGPPNWVELHAYGDSPADHPMLSIATQAWYRGRPWNPGEST